MKQNKNSVIVRIILWTLTALILLGVLLWGLELLPGLSIRGLSFGGWDFHYKDSAQYKVGSGSVSARAPFPGGQLGRRLGPSGGNRWRFRGVSGA